jgi:glycine/D-amino acid oxidase-like deaminating enzyme/nitrite reductase/ring-hydroxylating ferredoxin subunit
MSLGGPSFWIATTPETAYPALEDDLETDVAVVGGGIMGITTAVLLKRAGKRVALLESKRIVHGATGYTTAKVTAGHGALYAHLESSFGVEAAKTYAEAQQAAIHRVAQFVAEDGIDCDFERRANYVYAETAGEADQLRAEAEAEQRARLAASYVDDTPLPYSVAGAVRVDEQAQFHPRKYLLALAKTLPGDGSHVFENTRVEDVREGDPCVIRTAGGRTVRAADVVIATQLPILDRGLFFAKAHPHRSYALAAPLGGAEAPDGMFLNTGTPTRSVRTMRHGERVYLSVGGNGHKAGREPDTPERYDQLEQFLRTHWPAAGEVEYRWSTMDFMPLDRVPYIGRLRRRSKHVFTGTGFNKWGMTNGTVAALMLTQRILGNASPWEHVFESKRWHARASLGKFVVENSSTGVRFVADRLKPAGGPALEDLRPGEGAITRVRGRKTAVYRDENGKLQASSPVCQHLYCLVTWNPAERSWDCPCHGSRYAGDGTAIQGPTTRNLRPRTLR